MAVYSEKDDFLVKYKAISNTLRKKLFRLSKPNIAEASQQFSALVNQLQQQESHQYAGFCCLGLARCEHSLGNTPGEVQALIQGGRLSMLAEKQNNDVLNPLLEENLDSAINCYNHAIQTYTDQKHPLLSAELCLEVGRCLQKLGKVETSGAYFKQAADLTAEHPDTHIWVLKELVDSKLKVRDWDTSASLLSDMRNVIYSHLTGGAAFMQLLSEIEITLVLLTLYMRPNRGKLAQNDGLKKLMEKFTWQMNNSNDEIPAHFEEELFLTAQSVVTACQTENLEALIGLRDIIASMLTNQQNVIMDVLVENHKLNGF